MALVTEQTYESNVIKHDQEESTVPINPINHSNHSNQIGEYTLEQIITGIAKASNLETSTVKTEIMAMLIPEGIARQLSTHYFQTKFENAISNNNGNNSNGALLTSNNIEAIEAIEAITPLTPSRQTDSQAPTAELQVETEPETQDPRSLLKKLGLPSQLGSLKNLAPVPPPAKATKTELREVKALIKAGLEKLNKKGDKRSYILDHMNRGTEAGQVYINAFVSVYDRVDATEGLKKIRPSKIAKAVAMILDEQTVTEEESAA